MTEREAAVKSEYDTRAQTYEAARGGWHRHLAEDFVKWVKPKRGDIVLDLGCGTGLVTFAMAHAVAQLNAKMNHATREAGTSSGRVVGVDLNRAMLDVAEKKFGNLSDESRLRDHVALYHGDISDGNALDRIVDNAFSSTPPDSNHRPGEDSRRLFDIVSCCSTFVLMPDRQATLSLWQRYLRPGGRIILDVPTEDRSMYVLMNDILRPRLGLEWDWGWYHWIKGQGDVEALFVQSGFEVVQVVRTHSYFGDTKYADSDVAAMEFFEKQDSLKLALEEKGKLEEARRIWPDLFRTAKRDANGSITDGHCLYVVVAKNMTADQGH